MKTQLHPGARWLFRLRGYFGAFMLMLQIANAVVKQVLGRGLPLIVNAQLARLLGMWLGPIGWAITAVTTLFTVGSPAFRVTVPCVIYIATLRGLVTMREAGFKPEDMPPSQA